MSIAIGLLSISIAIVPALAILDGLVAQFFISALAATALVFIGISVRAADVNFVRQVTQYLKFCAAFPAIWMFIQILPVPFGSHSIWINANEALDQKSWGHISVDIGKTIEALAFYLANISLIVVSLFVAKDRRRAEFILLALTTIAALTVVALLISKWGLISGMDASEAIEMLGAVSSLGIILSLTTGTYAVERYDRDRLARSKRPTQTTQLAFGLSGAGLLICIAGLATSATLNIALVAAFGVLTFGSVQVIRRVSQTGWTTGILIATMIAAAIMIILWRYDPVSSLSPFLQFASRASSDAISVARRILLDTGWQGTGAATYALLLPIYQELGSSITKAPSAASALAIELGRPMTFFTIAAVIGLVVVLFRGALVRGRDSFYSTAAAACTIILLGQAFCDASLLRSCVAVIGDAVIGLGLAQSISQRDAP